METIGLYSGVLSFSILCLPEVRAGKCWLKVVPLKFDIVKKQQNFASFKNINLPTGNYQLEKHSRCSIRRYNEPVYIVCTERYTDVY